jgi:hypothetical protein
MHEFTIVTETVIPYTQVPAVDLLNFLDGEVDLWDEYRDTESCHAIIGELKRRAVCVPSE